MAITSGTASSLLATEWATVPQRRKPVKIRVMRRDPQPLQRRVYPLRRKKGGSR